MICQKGLSITIAAGCFTNPPTLPVCYYAVAYSTTLTPTSGLPGAFTKIGSLPTGLTLNPATGTISGTPSNAAEVGTFVFTAIFTPTNPAFPPCSQVFSLGMEIYCVAIEDLTWSITGTPDPSTNWSMDGGDGYCNVNMSSAGNALARLVSSTLLCLPAVFAQYPGTIEIDWSVFLRDDGGGAQSGIDLSARLNAVLLVPTLSRATSGSNITDSGTLSIATGMLQAGVSYVFWIDIATGINISGQVDLTTTIRLRPLTPP